MLSEDYIKKFDILVYGMSDDNFITPNHPFFYGNIITKIESSFFSEKLFFRFCGTTPEMNSEMKKFFFEFKTTTIKELSEKHKINLEKYDYVVNRCIIDAANRVMVNAYKKEIFEMPENVMKTVLISVFYYYCWLVSKGYKQEDIFLEVYSDLGKESVSN